jgi:hypothetical protein
MKDKMFFLPPKRDYDLIDKLPSLKSMILEVFAFFFFLFVLYSYVHIMFGSFEFTKHQ